MLETILINLTAATICFAGQCYPALVGKSTPIGEFTATQRLTDSPGYHGDVIQFQETDEKVFAIHRPWLLKPEQKRLQRLASNRPKDRVITSGCVNVDYFVYEQLLNCCSNGRVVITK